MPLFRSSFYWFIALLIILVIGFWPSYFSRLGSGMAFNHHFHGLTMLAWVLLLITQSWLIRNRKNVRHRAVGKVSFVLGPLVFISGVVVTLWSQATAEDPLNAMTLSFLWFGSFTAVLFGVLFALAITHRRNMQLHARFMVATALVFLVPGLARTSFNLFPLLSIPVPTFYQVTWVPFVIALWLLLRDWRGGKVTWPFALFCLLWAVHLWVWLAAPHWAWFQAFGRWVAEAGMFS